jgi:hypothetical protein
MDSEPDWMKQITSSTVCRYFYIMFGLIAVLAGFVVVSDVYLILSSRGKQGWMLLVRSLLAFAIPLINSLFIYILCSRSLLASK